MEFFNLWLPLIGGGILCAIAISAWFAEHHLTAIWFGFFGAVCLLLLFALQLTDHEISKRNLSHAKPSIGAARAYISIFQADVSHPIGSPPTMSITIKNTGRSYAMDLTWRAKFDVRLVADADKVVFDTVVPTTKQNLPPDGALSYQYTFSNWEPRADEQLASELIRIFAIGEVRFKDEDGIDRFVDYRLMSGGRFGIKSGVSPGKFGVDKISSN